jgi:hypothetical protein
MADLDHYEIYYADKLWNLIPAVYRSQDSDIFGQNGPLREMVNRIGAQAAVVRRSIDRLWQDQSIETCDDWVIPYIADLLATNLIASLDPRGQRLDVANTIYYRRRKGTMGVLEEIAHDITGWDARVVEFFRRLGRTRHNFDPPIGLPSATDDPLGNRTLQLAEGLIGPWTGTPMGGWADLRNAYGASQAQSPFGIYPTSKPPSAFDEYFHTADFRAGNGRSGWYNIPKLGVFLWRLQSFRVDFTTPVQAASNSPCYTFDPTGREIPLFAFPVRSVNMNWLEWVSPQEWQLPTPIGTPLLAVALANPEMQALYALLEPDGVTINFNALGVFTQPSSDSLVPSNQVTTFPQPLNTNPEIMVYPEKGKFRAISPLKIAFVTYCYGFPSTIGAGPYDRRVLGQALPTPPAPAKTVSGGTGLDTKLAAVAPTGTVEIDDSLTYTAVKDVSNIANVTVMAQNPGRPVIRLAPPAPKVTEWAFSGTDNSSTLVLDGLLVSGGDVVLKGKFGSVTLRCCTFDPGTAVDDAGTLVKAIDGRDLVPCHLWIEAEIEHLIIDRCILGPIATRKNGEIIQTLEANDTIVQSLGTDKAINLSAGEVQLSRCSILGKADAHQLYASECILDDVVNVENTQDGCVRFTAWSTGSVLPRQYESVQIAPGAPLFTSRNFGQPAYCQLQESVDNAIIPPVPPVATGASISAGAQNGSEMGAYARDKNPIKQRSLLIKYQEFMPLGLVPVVINVT